MSPVEIVGVAASFSLLAGWRLYACVAIAGLAMRLNHPAFRRRGVGFGHRRCEARKDRNGSSSP